MFTDRLTTAYRLYGPAMAPQMRARLRTGWQRQLLRAQIARERRQLARLPPQLLRDIGIDAQTARKEACRTELPPDRLAEATTRHRRTSRQAM